MRWTCGFVLERKMIWRSNAQFLTIWHQCSSMEFTRWHSIKVPFHSWSNISPQNCPKAKCSNYHSIWSIAIQQHFKQPSISPWIGWPRGSGIPPSQDCWRFGLWWCSGPVFQQFSMTVQQVIIVFIKETIFILAIPRGENPVHICDSTHLLWQQQRWWLSSREQPGRTAAWTIQYGNILDLLASSTKCRQCAERMGAGNKCEALQIQWYWALW